MLNQHYLIEQNETIHFVEEIERCFVIKEDAF